MSEINSQFFNGKTYSATDFVESNKNTMKDGILPNTDFFKVLPAGNMAIGVTSGRGWVQGHSFSSGNTLTFTLDSADGVLDRVDTVIIRLDLTTDNEKIECRVIKGTLGSSATAPVRNGTYYDLVIAHITVAHGTTAITTAMITDKRGDGNLCGWSGAISGDQFNFDVKADKTYCDNTFATKTTLTAYQLTITNGTTKTNADRLQGKAISATAPTLKQLMEYNGTQWTPASLGTATLLASAVGSGTVNYAQSISEFRYLYYTQNQNGSDGIGNWVSYDSGMIPVSVLPQVKYFPESYYDRSFLFNISATFSSTGVTGSNRTLITVWGIK